jgi:hypothetical protein
MRIPAWVCTAAAAFWEAAGGLEPFPRTLRGPIARSGLELTLKELPALGVRSARRYLTGLGVVWKCSSSDRPLRACLAAHAGAGLILLDAVDPPREQVFSLAHELAHFLRHYREPRRHARRRLGDGITEVLDGRRPPTAPERVHAVLAGLALGPHVHLMHRGPRRELVSEQVAAAEEEADQLAYELLAPAAGVAARGEEFVGPAGPARLEQVLREVFALPAVQAEDYTLRLLPPALQDPLLLRLCCPSRDL